MSIDESVPPSWITLRRRQECIYDEKEEKEKSLRNGRLDMVICEASPH